jgi:hypothetical protein
VPGRAFGCNLLQFNLERFNKAPAAGWLGNLPHYCENVGNMEKNVMPTRKHIQPGTKIGLKLTAIERKLILNDLIALDDNYANAIRNTPADQPVQFTLDDWDDLGGYIAAEANHTEDRKLEKKLDAIFDKIQKILETHTDEEPPKKNKKSKAMLSDGTVRIAEWTTQILVAAEKLGIKNELVEHLTLSPAQREILRLVPDDLPKTVKNKLAKKQAAFTVAEVAGMAMALAEKTAEGDERTQVALMLVIQHLLEQLQAVFAPPRPARKKTQQTTAKISSTTVFQFKVTLKGIEPPIWRRIQVKDCTLDKLHEHIQTTMGWTNSHLHQFEIDGVRYGDPELLCDDFDNETPINSLETRVSQIIPKNGKRFSFDYEYDFGDGWEHEVLFEGCLQVEKGTRYPLCLEGARACPPEDVGGIYGYQEYLEALANPKHEEHDSYMEWHGPFDPEAFDAKAAAKEMRKGLPNWREME